jgi:hypothetical protein
MAGRIVLDGFNPAIDSDGNLDAGATLTFYENGTTVLQAIYSDSSLQTPLANPMSPDAAGRFPVGGSSQVWAPDDYVYSIKMEFTNGDILTRDDVAGAFSLTHEVPIFWQGAIADGETYPVYLPIKNLRLPADLVESRFKVKGAAPTATATFTLQKNGTDIGTVSFATDKTPTVAFAVDIDFSPTDDFSIDGPSPADATLTDVAMNLAFQII